MRFWPSRYRGSYRGFYPLLLGETIRDYADNFAGYPSQKPAPRYSDTASASKRFLRDPERSAAYSASVLSDTVQRVLTAMVLPRYDSI